MEKESSSSSDSENAIENDLEVTDEAEKCTDLRRKRKFLFSKNDTNKKKLKTVKEGTSAAGKSFIYLGKTRNKKDSSLGGFLQHGSSKPPVSSLDGASFANQLAHDSAFEELPSIINPASLGFNQTLNRMLFWLH